MTTKYRVRKRRFATIVFALTAASALPLTPFPLPFGVAVLLRSLAMLGLLWALVELVQWTRRAKWAGKVHLRLRAQPGPRAMYYFRTSTLGISIFMMSASYLVPPLAGRAMLQSGVALVALGFWLVAVAAPPEVRERGILVGIELFRWTDIGGKSWKESEGGGMLTLEAKKDHPGRIRQLAVPVTLEQEAELRALVERFLGPV